MTLNYLFLMKSDRNIRVLFRGALGYKKPPVDLLIIEQMNILRKMNTFIICS